jgi:hypothetical protein
MRLKPAQKKAVLPEGVREKILIVVVVLAYLPSPRRSDSA